MTNKAAQITAKPGQGDPSVAILLATYNSQRFLRAQLDSIEAQQHKNWTMFASDNGSSDATLDILGEYRSRWGGAKLSILKGPGTGAVANFQSLVGNHSIVADYYAFADHDDIWLPHRLSCGVASLEAGGRETPALHGTRTKLIDQSGFVIGLSRLVRMRPSFAHALVQNFAGGNTFTFNAAARQHLARYAHLSPVVHDWWSYMLVAGIGGTVIYDRNPSLLYRQHESNLTGDNQGARAKCRRLFMLLSGTYREWTDTNAACLEEAKTALTAQNRAIFEEFCKLRELRAFQRIFGLLASPVRREGILENAVMAFGVALNKV